MSTERVANLIALSERLSSDPELDWDEVEFLLNGFPGWLELVRWLRYQIQRTIAWTVRVGSPQQYVMLPDEARRQLLEFFQPYALLLNDELTHVERAERLQALGINAAGFYAKCLHDGDEEVAEAACAVQQAAQEAASLLRGSETPAMPADQLLRSAPPGTGSADNLVQAAGAPGETVEPRPSWFRRLLSRPAR